LRISKNKIIFLLCLVLASCKTKYVTKEFKESELSSAPDYNKLSSWAANPEKNDSIIDIFYNSKKNILEADVFYVYPTLLSDKRDNSWTADISNKEQNNLVRNLAIKYQASAWASAGKIYSPLYRQVHYRSFFEPYTSNGGIKAGEIAYSDIKKAFEYYLEHYNKGRPIIIAGHSQGAYHCKTLLKEFFDGKELQNQLIAAYLPGTRVDKNEFKTIKPLKNPNDVNGYLCWNTFRIHKKPKKNKNPAYFSWKKNHFVTNPIKWDLSDYTQIEDHKGLFFYDQKIYPASVKIEIYDGIVWSSVPKGIKGGFLLKLIKDYHFGDINIFWKDISENAKNRVKTFIELNK